MANVIKTDGSVVNVSLEVQLFKEGDYIVSYCSALELSSFGQTEDEAKQGFEGALGTFLEETSNRGTLEKVLLDPGWSLVKKPKPNYKPPRLKMRFSAKNPAFIRSFRESIDMPV
jgi:predicted RNase H-like HicB family nuclease